MKTKHTPTPWVFAYGSIYQGDSAETAEENAGRIAKMDRDNPHTMPTERDANAQFIVQACNHHEELVAALDELCREVKVLEMFGETGSTATQENVDIAVLKASSLLTKLKG